MDTMMPTIRSVAKLTTLQIPLQMPPVRVPSAPCAQGRMWSFSSVTPSL